MISNAEPNDLTLTVFSAGSNLRSVLYTTGVTGVFAGIQDLTGFDRVVVDVSGPATGHFAAGHFAADLFRFDTPSATGVPAPATLALLGAGLLGVAWLRRR